MEIQEENANGINPKNMPGTERYQIRFSEEHNDVLMSEKRETKSGKGVFTQHTLFLNDDAGEERELRFLFTKHLNPLIRSFGGDTLKWQGKDILVMPQTKGEYADVKLEAAGKRLSDGLKEIAEEQVV